MSKKVSMQAIADRLGLSKYTVSQALSGKSGVSEDNRRRIQETAKAMGYVLQPKASIAADIPPLDLTPDTTDAEGTRPYLLVWIHAVYQQDNPFWGKVLAGIAQASIDNGYDHLIVPVSQHDKKLQVPAYLNKSRCVGHLLAGTFPADSVVALKMTGLPLVLIDHEEPLVEVDCVVNNNLGSGAMALERLLTAGAKRIVFIGDDAFALSFKERWWGCRLAMEDHRSSADDPESLSLKKWQVAFGQPHMAHQLERKLSALSGDGMPDGFICANDQLALALMPLLKQRGLSIPGQARVIGLDNIEAAVYAQPPLSTIELGKEALGIRAVETLLYRMQHPGRQAEKIVLSSRFIARESG